MVQTLEIVSGRFNYQRTDNYVSLPSAMAQKLRLRSVQLRAVTRCCIVFVCQRFTVLRLL